MGIETIRLSYGLLAPAAQWPAMARLSHGMLWRKEVIRKTSSVPGIGDLWDRRTR